MKKGNKFKYQAEYFQKAKEKILSFAFLFSFVLFLNISNSYYSLEYKTPADVSLKK